MKIRKIHHPPLADTEGTENIINIIMFKLCVLCDSYVRN
jgi:hypothetical protein